MKPSRIIEVAQTLTDVQAKRKVATSRLTTIMAEAKKLRATLACLDKTQAIAQCELEVLAEQQ